ARGPRASHHSRVTSHLLLGPFGAVLGSTLLTISNARTVERAAHRVIAHTGQILHTPTADQHNRVLLQVVPLATNVADDLEAVRQPHFCDLAQRRVRL